ncbi:hypothetical protein GGI35DRAFT_489754 [Trichoderma velutinum]
MHILIATPLLLSLAALTEARLSAAAIVKKIAPGAGNCTDTTECRTADQAAPFIAKNMSDYGIFTAPEMAAIISLMAFESVDFKYKHNVSPGRPGQGAANMQMANFNLLYAQNISSTKDHVSKYTSTDGLNPDDLNYILSLVQPDELNFASGAWFYATQCNSSVQEALWADVNTGFYRYMGCVGTSVTDERLAYFTRAKEAFGLI